ncbi:ataxin-10 homolog [Phtheirospermum japonicum]|uniref:Ataxin-10 homolog n=1 Tax=Phtheirospermum japonicum TaxID=374723 RepID=A0A830B2V4_9LAMI|nr:ataxin-10 homolog [Phtheirospermum japonicum]
MDNSESHNSPLPDNIVEPLFAASETSNLNNALECLIETAKNINLCAGEIKNQNLFIEQNGVETLSLLVSSLELSLGSDNGLLPMVLQVLGNVSLAGEQHRSVVWLRFFPDKFLDIAKVRSKETCDPLCMVIYTCSEGSNERSAELFAEPGQHIIVEIIKTITIAGFRQDWVKLLLSRICIEEPYFPSIFSKLPQAVETENSNENASQIHHFGAEKSFFLSILSEILNERVGDIVISNDFSLCIFEFQNGTRSRNTVDLLVTAGLIKLLIDLLHEVEPLAMIRKAMNTKDAENKTISQHYKYCCLYKGFRRDIVVVLGNCSYRKKHVQDEIRERNGILVLLQQCVIDEDNPFMREWGIWSMRNILEGNMENRQLVADLELQDSVDSPEIAGLGLRVEVDPRTRRPKLVNAS